MKFGKFIKRLTIEVIVARDAHQGETVENKLSNAFQERSAVLYLHPKFAKEMGFKEGDVVELEADERTLRVRVAYSETAPENGGMMPNSIFSNYFVKGNKKRFEVSISPTNNGVTRIEEILFGNTV